jgi:hypothetical protein
VLPAYLKGKLHSDIIFNLSSYFADGWMIDNFECAHCALSTVILWFVTGIKIETHVNMKEKLRSLLRQWRDGEDNALLKTVAKVAH